MNTILHFFRSAATATLLASLALFALPAAAQLSPTLCTAATRGITTFSCDSWPTKWILGNAPTFSCYAGATIPTCNAPRTAYSCGQGACVCPSGTYCAGSNTCVVPVSCPAGQSVVDVCVSNTCSTPNVLRSPAVAQSNSWFNVSGSVNPTTGTPTVGSTYFNTAENNFRYYNGSAWLAPAAAAASQWVNGASGAIYYNGGSVGIGINAPDSKVQVFGVGVTQLKVTGGTSSAVGTVVLSENDYGWIGTQTNHGLHIGTVYNSKMFINTSGDIGFGTFSPTGTLHVTRGSDVSAADSDGYIILGATNSTNLAFDNNEIMARDNGAATTLNLNNDGGLTSLGGELAVAGGATFATSSPNLIVEDDGARGDAILQLRRGSDDKDQAGISFGENNNANRWYAGLAYRCGSTSNDFVVMSGITSLDDCTTTYVPKLRIKSNGQLQVPLDGGYGFDNRADTGVFGNGNYSVSLQAPEYVSINIDSNGNNCANGVGCEFTIRNGGAGPTGGTTLLSVDYRGCLNAYPASTCLYAGGVSAYVLNSDYWYEANNSGGTMYLGTSSAEVNVRGRLGIDEATPDARLHILNDEDYTPALLSVSTKNTSSPGRFINTNRYGDGISISVGEQINNRDFITFWTPNTPGGSDYQQRGRLQVSGPGVALTSSSDARLKENVVTHKGALARLMDVKVRDYTLKLNGVHETGFIAQELYNAIPEVVSVGGDDVTKEPWMVDKMGLIPFVIAAVQEQQEEIESLEIIVRDLKVELSELKARLE